MDKVIIFSAPSGSGKSSIIHYLLERNNQLEFSISATSRKPRGVEKNGVDYYFLSPAEFREKINKAEFIEYEEVYNDTFYGTLKMEIERIHAKNKCVVFDVDVLGGINLKKIFGDKAISIFIMPPSIDELRNRLIKRNTDSMEVIEKRVEKATYEMQFASKFDVVVLNEDLEKARSEVMSVVENFICK